MAPGLVLERIAAWERSGIIDHALAERLRAAEAATPEPAAGPAAAYAAAAPAPSPAAAPAPARTPASSTVRLRSSSFILEFFLYLGGAFILLAWYAWFLNEPVTTETVRLRGIAVATLIPAFVLGATGWALAGRADERLRRAASIALAVAVANLGVGTSALAQALGVTRIDDPLAAVAGAGAALALAAPARIRRPGAITQAVLLAAWGILALELASWVESSMTATTYDQPWGGEVPARTEGEQVAWSLARLGWWWLVAAIPAVVMLRRPDRGPGHQSRDAVARIGIGATAVLGSASAAFATFDWSLARGGEPIFGPWLAAGIMLGVGAVFVGAARVSGSRIHLVTAAVAIVAALTYLNVEYVVDVVGTPVALLVEGLILLGVAALGWAAGRLVTRRGPGGPAVDPADAG